MREPQTSWVNTLRPRLSVPSGPNSDGDANAGLSAALTARRPASSASSGAVSAMRMKNTRMPSPSMPARSWR